MDPRSVRLGAQSNRRSARLAPAVPPPPSPSQVLDYGRRQATLAAFSRRILSLSSIDDLLDTAARAIGHALQTAYVAAFEFDRGADLLQLRAGSGWREGLVGGASVHAGTEFQEGYALDRPDPIVVADHNSEIRFAASPLLVEHGILSSVCTVVRATQGPFGLLGAYAPRPRAFSQDDAQFLQVVAHVTSTNLARIEAELALVESRLKPPAPRAAARLDSPASTVDGAAPAVDAAARLEVETAPPADETEVVSGSTATPVARTTAAVVQTTAAADATEAADVENVAAPAETAPPLNEAKQPIDQSGTPVATVESAFRQHERQLAAWERVAELATSALPLDARLRRVVEEVTTATGFAMGAIELWNAERQAVVLGAASVSPNRQPARPIEVPPESTLAGPVIRGGRATIEDADSTTPERREALQRIGAKTFVCFPLIVQDVVIGALSLAHPESKGCDEPFSDWLSGLCHCVSLLVHTRNMEQTLQRSQERAQMLFDHEGPGFAVSHPHGRFLEANRAMCRILGYDAEELLQKTWTDVIHADDRQKYTEFKRKIEKNRLSQYTTTRRLVTKNDDTLEARVFGSVSRDSDGNARHELVMLQDITELGRVQERLRVLETETQRLERVVDEERRRHERDGRLRVVQARDDERTKLSRDLSDGVGRVLSALQLSLRSKAQNRDDLDTELRTLGVASSMLQNLSYTLRPEALQRTGVSAAVRESLSTLASTPSVSVETVGSEPTLSPERKTHLYRIVHEAVTHAIQHARPANVWVRFVWGSDSLELTIADDGQATDQGTRSEVGPQRRNMRDRAVLLQGTASWMPRQDGGTLVRVRIPQLNAATNDGGRLEPE